MLVVLILVAIALSGVLAEWPPAGVQVERFLRTDTGRLQFVHGRLGVVDRPLLKFIHSLRDLLELDGSESFEESRREVDFKGNLHVHFKQYIKTVEVDGGELALHYNPTTGVLFAVSANLMSMNEAKPLLARPHLGNAVAALRHAIPQDSTLVSTPEFLFLMHDDIVHAAFRAKVELPSVDRRVLLHSHFYVNAHDGKMIVDFPMFFPALNRSIFSANQTETLPGIEWRTEGGKPTGDSSADDAYSNAGVCYDFYKKKFNRDSYDNKGGPMWSTVHYGEEYNNAFWNGTQMAYGDGDGEVFTAFSSDLSVVCHELTHAVVQYTAGLRYYKESGALNEAFADIMGSSADIFNHSNCIFPQQWQIGYKCYVAGEALRYMNNPALDGSSYDYYPERYTGILDAGGVHSNSGIANLAYVLFAQGGVHPRQKTQLWVQGVGLDAAEQVFYAALSQYMMRTTNFEGARFATEIAASELYGKAQSYSVSRAWYAVGVGAVPPKPPAPKPPKPTATPGPETLARKY